MIITHSLTAGDSTILLRRRVIGVGAGDDGVDFVNGGTSENRRVGLGEGVDKNNVWTFNLFIILTWSREKRNRIIIGLLVKNKVNI